MKKLWETKTFDSEDGGSRKGKALAVFTQHFLTILLSLFLLIVVGILFIVLYTSNGGNGQAESESAFYDPNKPSSTAVVAVAQSSASSSAATENSAQSSDQAQASQDSQASQATGTSGSSSSRSSNTRRSMNASQQAAAEAAAAAQAQAEAQAAYEAEVAAQQAAATQAATPVVNGGTDSVYTGEGAAAIAARNGLTLEQLYALNPDKMTGPGGTWWANPGDVVIVN